MKKTFLFLMSSFFLTQVQAQIEVRPSCYKAENEDIMFMDMFPWGQTYEQMDENFHLIYKSKKRMANRVYYNGENFIMPFMGFSSSTEAIVPESFIKALVSQIESALDHNYVDYINFSDMGHSHFFIPLDLYRGELKKVDYVNNKAAFYEILMNSKDVISLYHTAEQLKFFTEKYGDELVDDRKVQKRFYTRNIVGKMDGKGHLDILFNLDAKGNGVSKYRPEDYKYWGGGFSFNSTEEGCFSYQKNGKKYYFDLSPDDVGYNSDDMYEF